MEFRQSETILGGEVEYLAALFAFRDQALNADQLQLAIARLISGESPTILEAIRSLETVEPVKLAAAIKMAQLYCNMNATDNQPRRPRQEFGNNHVARIQHQPLQHDSEDTIEFEDAPEPAVAPMGPEYEWEPTSDWVSHLYYVEDSLRSYTGGRLGIVSSLTLFVCLIAIIWGAIQYQFFTGEAVDSRVINLPQTETFDNLDESETSLLGTPDDASLNSGMTGDSSTESESASSTANEVIGSSAATEAQKSTDSTAGNINDRTAIGDNSKQDDGFLSIPVSSGDGVKGADGQSPTTAPELNRNLSDALINEEINVAMTEISTGDLASARSRLVRIYNSKVNDLQPKDVRWLRLGITVLLEGGNPEDVQTATKWLRHIDVGTDPLTELVVVFWIMRSNAQQKGELTSYFSSELTSKSNLPNWFQAANANYSQAIPTLEAEIAKPQSHKLNHLFLATAYYVPDRIKEAIQQLDLFAASSEIPAIDPSLPEAQWISDTCWKSITSKADQMRAKATAKK